MTIGYYSDEMCDDLAKFMQMNPKSVPYFGKIRKQLQSHAVHFQLPHGGYILPDTSDSITIDTNILRPPYPVTVIEYPEGGGELRYGEEPSTKRLVLAVDEGDSVVLFPAFYNDNRDVWTPAVLYWRIRYERSFSLSRTIPRDFQDSDVLTYGEGWAGAVSSQIDLETYAAMEIRNINQELSVYMDFCMAMAEYETEIVDQKPDERQRKMRRMRGKKPLFTYKIITITGKRKVSKESKGGTHASPVTHLRRGHWRHYKSGKRAWVEAMVVNGKDGMVAKDYRVESRA